MTPEWPGLCAVGGWPGLNAFDIVDMEPVRGYHFSNSRESRETEGAPGSVFWYLGLGAGISFRHVPMRADLADACGGLGFSFEGLDSGAGDGNRTNPIEPNKGVTTRSTVQLESNGVKLRETFRLPQVSHPKTQVSKGGTWRFLSLVHTPEPWTTALVSSYEDSTFGQRLL